MRAKRKRFIIATALVLFGVLLYLWMYTPIRLPDAENISRFELRYFDESWGFRGDNIVVKDDPADIEEILSILSGATLIRGSWLNTMNETPHIAPRLRITTPDTDRFFRSYLYVNNGRGYFYFAYESIYRLSASAVERMFEIYERN